MIIMKQSNIKAATPVKASLFRSNDESKAHHTHFTKKKMAIPAANIDETATEYILTIASPGFKKKDFKVNIEKDFIVITAAKENLPDNLIHDRCEYDYTQWKRSFLLPDDADALMTRSHYIYGELIIRIPKGKTDQSSCTTTIYVY
jgi:HSP20 family protein